MSFDKSLFFNHVLMNGIQEMVFIIKVDEYNNFYYDFLNNAVLERTILTEEVLGKSIQEVNPKVTADFLTEKYLEAIKTQKSITYEDYYESPDGIKYSETTLTPISEGDDSCAHIVALVKDITQRKLNEFEIQTSKDSIYRNKQRYRSLYEYNLDAILSLDLSGKITNGNNAVESVFGYKAEMLTNSPFTDLIIPEDVNQAQKSLYEVIKGEPIERQLKVLHQSREAIEVIVKLTPIIVNGDIVGIFGIFKDINERIQLGKKVRESEDHFRIIAENSNDLITMIDNKGEIVYVSPSYKEVLGYRQSNYVSKPFLHNVHSDDHERLKESFKKSIHDRTTWKEQFQQKHGNGTYIWSELHGSPVYDETGKFTHMVVVSRNITTRKDYEKRLQHMAYHDVLTGLPNRRSFMNQLTQCLDEITGTNQRLAIIMMDLDRFKLINDRMGHAIGDQVIREFGKRICGIIRDGDILARLGGDEFTLLLPDIGSVKNVIEVVDRIITVMNECWRLEGYEFQTTTSLGIAISSSYTPESADTLLKYADKGLYKTKKAGRNNYRIYDFMKRIYVK
ncbi:sensor domain-containing protein [Virgibacillus doumboii]|uniref:sensor domain-containing protein n=1 Tax=Virgibacillus doumboii TaxID=2697503 RepID=UPI0013E01E1E|nr:PAS domain S-box protein [Virgibacillus doumboii]